MFHIALRVVYVLFLAWLGLNIFLSIVLVVVILFSRLTAVEAVQEISVEADPYSATDNGKPMY
jgi:hypothetical protein